MRQELDQGVAKVFKVFRVDAVFQDKAEFITAEAGDIENAANHGFQALADFDEQLVTRCMSEGVVDRLEAIQIDHANGEVTR